MKQSKTMLCLVTAISLLLSAIWPCSALATAVGPPDFVSLGQYRSGDLGSPRALDVDAAGNLYVADRQDGQVLKVDSYGVTLGVFEAGASGDGLAVDSLGEKLYVSRGVDVAVLDAQTGQQLALLSGSVPGGSEFVNAAEIDLDSFGNVYVADTVALVIKVYGADNQYVTSLGAPGVGAGFFGTLAGIVISPTNQVVAVDNSSVNPMVHVFVLDEALAVDSVVGYSRIDGFGADELISGRGIAYDHLGRGYFLEYIRAEIRVVDSGFTWLSTYYGNDGDEATPITDPGQLSHVVDIAFDDTSDRMYVSCSGSRLEIFGVDGGETPILENHAPGAPTAVSPLAASDVASLTPTLVIGNATDEDGDSLTYHVVVTEDVTDGAIVFEADVAEAAGGQTTIQVSGVELVENAAYVWTAQASDGELSSPATSEQSFGVNATEEAPEAPVLVSPLGGAHVDGLNALVWNESTDPDPSDDALSYLITIALDDAFTQVVTTETADSSFLLNQLAEYSELVEESSYYWQVVAIDEDGDESDASLPGRFTYDPSVLTVAANMPGAMVSLSGNLGYAGREVGVAPVELRDLPAGIVSVVVKRKGFETFVAQATIVDGEKEDIYASLIPAKNLGEFVRSWNSVNLKEGLVVAGDAAPFLVDYDNDGDLDLLVGDASGQITLFNTMKYYGAKHLFFSFDAGVSLGLPVIPGATPYVVDWNNDDRKDLLVGAADGTVKLFVNTGLEEAPSFAAGVDLQASGATLTVGSSAAPAVMDYDGDGDKDLLIGNGNGQVMLTLNQGTDAAPVLTDPVELFQTVFASAAAPFPVDWHEQGRKDIWVASGGIARLYVKIADGYREGPKYRDNGGSGIVAVFPLAHSERGKEFILGREDGRVDYAKRKDAVYTPSFMAALQDKVAELNELVELEAPTSLPSVVSIAALVDAADYGAAKLEVDVLMAQLGSGVAVTSATELSNLLSGLLGL